MTPPLAGFPQQIHPAKARKLALRRPPPDQILLRVTAGRPFLTLVIFRIGECATPVRPCMLCGVRNPSPEKGNGQ